MDANDDGNRRIVLAARPRGEPNADSFRLEHGPIPEPNEDELVARTIYLSLDPYMRGRMNDAPSYAAAVEIGEVMTGGTVGQVIASKLDGFEIGDFVLAQGGWQDYATLGAGEARRLDPSVAPIGSALGVLGMPGLTAWSGLREIGRPEPGETLVLAAASGAVGALVGQIAKLRGCRVVGLAGSADKRAYLLDELGFDAALDYRAPDFAATLEAACPEGIDIYWENVGGPLFEAVLPLLNTFARVPVCGLIHWYNATSLPKVTDPTPALMRAILVKRLTLRGFIVFDHADLQDEFVTEIGAWLREGKIRYREDVRDGLENAPDAFAGLLRGENFGKLLIRVSDDPTVGG